MQLGPVRRCADLPVMEVDEADAGHAHQDLLAAEMLVDGLLLVLGVPGTVSALAVGALATLVVRRIWPSAVGSSPAS